MFQRQAPVVGASPLCDKSPPEEPANTIQDETGAVHVTLCYLELFVSESAEPLIRLHESGTSQGSCNLAKGRTEGRKRSRVESRHGGCLTAQCTRHRHTNNRQRSRAACASRLARPQSHTNRTDPFLFPFLKYFP